MDHHAVAALRDEVLDWRDRWVPPDWYGRTVAETIGARLDEVDGPVPVLDRAALDHNLAAMAGWCDRVGVSLAPHGKTTMAPRLIADQVAHGAWGVTVASLAQARVLHAFGVTPIVVANQVVDRAGLRWVARTLREDPDFRLLCWVDSVDGVALLDGSLAGAGRPADVLVEMGAGRAGCRTPAAAEEVARAATAARHLRLVGVSGFEGTLTAVGDVDRFLGTMVSVARRLAPLFEGDEVIMSAGGSAYFDRVAAILPGAAPPDRPLRTVVRSGCYLTHDAGYYAGITPAARGVPDVPVFRDALRVRASVVSRPEPGLALLAAGRRDLPYDQGLPVVVSCRGEVTALNDQHAYLALPPDEPLRPGDTVTLGVSHPCSLFDRWTLLPVVEGDSIVDLVRTFF